MNNEGLFFIVRWENKLQIFDAFATRVGKAKCSNRNEQVMFRRNVVGTIENGWLRETRKDDLVYHETAKLQ